MRVGWESSQRPKRHFNFVNYHICKSSCDFENEIKVTKI